MKQTFLILLISVISTLSINAQYSNTFNNNLNTNNNNNVRTVRLDTNAYKTLFNGKLDLNPSSCKAHAVFNPS